MKPLDNLCHPVSVIREAEELAADAFGAAHAFLMVGGTTTAVQTMVLSVCKRGDEIILPRNVHRSVFNALVLCGAIPVYVNPEVDHRLGISLGMRREQVAKAIAEHPDAVAVLVNNPTYYGICSDLRAIVKMAHDAGMLCLADEAHGTHFYFGGGLPVSAMAAGADMASVSMHKSGGSLTQSSLITGPNVHAGHVRQIINLTQTTSGSYLLMSSLAFHAAILHCVAGRCSIRCHIWRRMHGRKSMRSAVIMHLDRNWSMEIRCLTLTLRSLVSIHGILGLRASRCMIFFGMSMIFR